MKLKSNETVEGVGILGMKLLDELSKTSEDNIICSPFSIATTMAMVRFLEGLLNIKIGKENS